MTAPDDSRDEPGRGTPGDEAADLPDDSGDGERDFDAAFRAIVENYGERPTLGDPVAPAPEPAPKPVDPARFDTSHLDRPPGSDEHDRARRGALRAAGPATGPPRHARAAPRLGRSVPATAA